MGERSLERAVISMQDAAPLFKFIEMPHLARNPARLIDLAKAIAKAPTTAYYYSSNQVVSE